MDAMMADVAAQFPAKTAGHGGDRMEPKVLADGTKEFDLEAKIVKWEVSPGKLVDAWTYNGVVPAPEIHVNDGDKVRIVLKNSLPESTSLHLHGIRVPNAMDGVDPYTQPPIQARRELHLRVRRQGSRRRHLPLAPRRPGAGAQRPVRRVHDRRDAHPAGAAGQGLHQGRQDGQHGVERCRHDRTQPQRQELPGDRADDAPGRPGPGGQLPQRGPDGAPDAPAPAGRLDHRQGRRAARRADARRHDPRRSRASATRCSTRPRSRASGPGTATS